MRHPCVRPLSKLALSLLVSSISSLGLACGSSDEEGPSEPPPSANGAAGSSTQPAGAMDGSNPAAPSAEEIAALTEVFGMAADQIQAACGPSFDRCEATPGCDDILSCAARSACAGADCYCLGEGCTMDGPCRSVIDSAPGARAPDATSASLGPASDAASAVGACLQGLGGGGLGGGGVPTPPQPPTTPADAGAQPDAG